jgi:phosphoglycerol transferase MdoB-like AlkP superfamily enzyme
MLSIVFLIGVVDIPFFNYFFSRLSTSIFVWANNGAFAFKMILKEIGFIAFFFVWLILVIGYHYFLKKKFKLKTAFEKTAILKKVAVFLFFGILIFLGIRGRISPKSPIRIGTAYFSNNSFINQLGLNPVFTLVKSIEEDLKPENQKVELMNCSVAYQLACTYLDRNPENFSKYYQGKDSLKPNIILVIMESMGSYKIGDFSGPDDLTPNFQNLIKKGLFYSNTYSAGIHTFNGLYSTLYSFPALFKQHPLNNWISFKSKGLPHWLKTHQYKNVYFTTHDGQFDNAAGFLMNNGFDEYKDVAHYPSKWNLSSNGVPDHILFDEVIQYINKNTDTQPLFITALTSSDHKPWVIPKNVGFTPRSKTKKNQIIEYADWSIGRFIEMAKNQSWFKNTIFVFIADHGLSVPNTYEMPLSYHKIPMLFYAPGLIPADTVEQLAGQIDLAPTLMGLLNLSFNNQTMGENLNQFKREMIYFCADDKIGCLDTTAYFIWNFSAQKKHLFKYKKLDKNDYIDFEKKKALKLEEYAKVMMQATQYIKDNKIVNE